MLDEIKMNYMLSSSNSFPVQSSKPINIIVHIASSNHEHRYPYAIGTIFRIHQWPNEQPSIKHLLFFANVQNGVGAKILNLLLHCESISDACQKLCYSTEDSSKDCVDFSRFNFVFCQLESTKCIIFQRFSIYL
jgi:hypothetical protein